MHQLVAAYFGGVATVVVFALLWLYFFAPRDVPAAIGAHVDDDLDDDDWDDDVQAAEAALAEYRRDPSTAISWDEAKAILREGGQ